MTIEEAMLNCKECGRRWHKVCALHMEEIWSNGFVCPGCLNEQGKKRFENPFTAKNLPVNELSKYLEQRAKNFLKRKGVISSEVVIRVLASSDKKVEVKPLMRSCFTERGELPESFPYREKAIFAFQKIDDQDVSFFAMFVQEFGSECPNPNTRCVYLAYLDSVFYFQPKQYRTDVYHEILLGYLQYAKWQGYRRAYIWSCPPAKGVDYVFHKRPVEQRIPDSKRLENWYEMVLQKAVAEGTAIHFDSLLEYAKCCRLDSPTQIPYFEGDYWPNVLEDILKVCNPPCYSICF